MRTWLVVLAMGCSGGKDAGPGPGDGDADTDADADSDSDADTDTDTDSDTDTDTDADTDTDTDTEPTVNVDGDGFPDGVDCDDTDPAVYPGAPDPCDGVVTDCDRTSDEGLVTVDGATTYDDLQLALDAASAGSEVLVCPGTQAGAFVAAVPVRLRALEDASTTFLDAIGTYEAALTVPGGTEVVGLTIVNGAPATDGGGVRLVDAGTLLLDSCVVTGNQAPNGGGIYVAPGGTATLVDTAVTDNWAFDGGGGGIEVGPGGTADLSAGSTVSGNTGEEWGGGVWLDEASLIGGVVSGNLNPSPGDVTWDSYGDVYLTAALWGGSAIAVNGVSTVTGTEVTGQDSVTPPITASLGLAALNGVSVHDNVAAFGGGIGGAGGVLQLDDASEVVDNEATYGGGAYLLASTVIGGRFERNAAAVNGGGIYASDSTVQGATVADNTAGARGGGVFFLGTGSIDGTTATGNTAGTDGGGLLITNNFPIDPIEVTGCSFVGNQADRGGGLLAEIAVHLADPVLTDNLANDGAGAYLLDDATVDGGSVLRNVATSTGGGFWLDQTGLDATAVDLGTGADDNGPADVRAGTTDHAYADGVTFSCAAGACTP